MRALRLYRDPNDGDDDIHALGLTAVVFEAPEAVGLLIPEGLGRGVHAAPTDMGLAVGGRGAAIAGADMRLVGLSLASALWLVQGGGRDEMLDDRAIYDELVRRALGPGGG